MTMGLGAVLPAPTPRRQGDCDGGADALRAGEFDRPAMQLDELLRHVQPETGAPILPRVGILDLDESLEHVVELVRGNADSSIRDTEPQAAPGVGVGGNGDAAALRCELHRIAE